MSEGAKRYQPESVQGRVASVVEGRARMEFGPELLDKDEVACALNLPGEALTQEEWEEISEFALNAGAELLQAAVAHDPLPTTPKEEERFARQVHKNKYRMFPIHDLFHAAYEYRATGGEAVTPPFVEVSVRERYTNPSLIRSELWPALFLISQTMSAPLAVLLASPEGRQDLDTTFGEGGERPNQVRQEITGLLERPVPATPEALRAEYERLVGLMVIANAVEKVPDIVATEVLALREEAARAGEEPDPYYDQFAKRVFGGEWQENPRLFLDEFLVAIRTKPRPVEELSSSM